jgi:hypothetical protein
MSRLADRFGSNQSKSPFLYNVRLYSNALLPPIHPSIPGLVCTYKHVDICMVHVHDGLLFTISEMSEEGEGGGGNLYFITLLYSSTLSLFLSRLDVLFPVVFVYLVYVYLSMCIQDDAYTHQDPFFFFWKDTHAAG